MNLKDFLKLLKSITICNGMTWNRYYTTSISSYIEGCAINIWLDDDDDHCYIKINNEIYSDIRDYELDNLVWDLLETVVNKGDTIPKNIYTKLKERSINE